jgi:hypothetical protein
MKLGCFPTFFTHSLKDQVCSKACYCVTHGGEEEEEESLRARHKTVLFHKIVSFCFRLCDVKGYAKNQKKNTTTKAHFTLGVKANVQPKSSIPIGAKVEISLMGFYTRSQG